VSAGIRVGAPASRGFQAYNWAMKQLLERLGNIGYERPRVAVALLPLSLFTFVYLLATLNAPPEWKAALGGLSVCYLTAFLALGSEWFWARWFASGLGWSGSVVAVAGLVMMGWNPVLAIYGALHAIVVVTLLGPKMATRYDLQPGWRERYGMDEFGVVRLRKAVTRAAAALPSVIIWALGPRDGDGSLTSLIVGICLTVLGLHGLLRFKTWGLLALAGAATAVLVGGPSGVLAHGVGSFEPLAVVMSSPGSATALALLLAAAAAPFARGAVRYIRSAR
jgi:hypothetical protein